MEQDTNAATERGKKKAEEERTELPIEELTFKCLHQVILDSSYLLLSTLYGVLFTMGNYGLQKIGSTYQIVTIFIDKKHITKTRSLLASRFKLLNL